MIKYPRILIFGHSFNNYTGMGITLTNLFADWPKGNIAVWANGLEPSLCDSIRPCIKYIGNIKHSTSNFPIQRKYTLKNKCKDFFRNQYLKTGLQDFKTDKYITSEIGRAHV